MSPVTCMLLGEDAIRKRGSVGKVIPTVAARVVDENMNDVPIGEVGEIVYRAPTLMSGYWNNPQPPPRRSPAVGSIPETSFGWTTKAMSGGRPQEGHDHLRRREHLLRGSGERSRRPSGIVEVAVIGAPMRSGERCRSRLRPSPTRRCGWTCWPSS